MRINCVIDDQSISADMNTHMPLSELIRQRGIGNRGIYSSCNGGKCMRCLCFIEDSVLTDTARDLLPSCLIPAFRLNGKKVTTSERFFCADEAGDVIDAYDLLKLSPCLDCFEPKTMIFSHIADEYLAFESKYGGIDSVSLEAEKERMIATGMSLSPCSCLSGDNIRSIADTVISMRRNRIV